MFIPGEVIAGVVSAQAAVTVAIIVFVGRLRVTVAKLEEWVRQEERRRNHSR